MLLFCRVQNTGETDMIINLERSPDYSLYYIGGIVVEYLKKHGQTPVEQLYVEVKANIGEKMHIDFLYYALDWLYLLSLIETDKNKVILCV